MLINNTENICQGILTNCKNVLMEQYSPIEYRSSRYTCCSKPHQELFKTLRMGHIL